MTNSKHQLLTAAIELQSTLIVINDLLDGYKEIGVNKNYVKYCRDRAIKVSDDLDTLNQLRDDTYNSDVTKRKGINIAVLVRIVKRYFKLLDDIDTAGDMFKPEWCKYTSAVEQLHRNRWLFVSIEDKNKDDSGLMVVNGDCFKKEERVVLNITEKDIFKDLDFETIEIGDVVQNKGSGNSYVISDVDMKDKTATAVETISISNKSEWRVLNRLIKP